MAISADDVKKLREITGAGMMDCKKALVEADGNSDKAIQLLRERGLAVAKKREARTASEGLIGSYLSDDGTVGALVEVNCETTFVAKTDEFVQLANRLAVQAANTCCCCGSGCLTDQPFIDDTSKTVGEYVNELMGKIGEKLAVARFAKLSVDGSAGLIGSYIHTGSQIGVLVELDCESAKAAGSEELKQLAKDLAMHISWSNPDYLVREDVPAEVIEQEREIHKQWAIKEGKPEKVIDRIVDGRMNDFYSRACLMEQAFIKDEDQTIKKLVDGAAAKLGEKITIGGLVRYRVGETSGESG